MKPISVPPPPVSLLAPFDAKLAVLLLVMMTAFSILPAGFEWSSYEASYSEDGSIGFKIQWALVFGITFLLALKYRTLALQTLGRVNPMLLVFVLYVAMTLAWSELPIATAKKIVQLVGILTAAVVFQLLRKPLSFMLKIVLSVIFLIELASVFVGLAVPSIGVDPGFGTAWRGVLSGKNALGYVAAIYSILWLGLAVLEPISIRIHAIGLGLGALCLIKSTSSTGLTIAILGMGIILLVRRQHIGSPLWLVRSWTVVSIVVLCALQVFFIQESRLPEWKEIIGPFAKLFGKGSDLTGRTEIWEFVRIEIERHWLLGIGYGAFWHGPGSAAQIVIDHLPWIPTQAHNGYLDIWNELGTLGLLLMACVLLAHIHQLFQLASFNRPVAGLHGAIVAVTCVSNFSESSLFRGVGFENILLIFSIVSVSILLHEHRSNFGINTMTELKNRPIKP